MILTNGRVRKHKGAFDMQGDKPVEERDSDVCKEDPVTFQP
jgi:hypothetical protein